MASSSSTPLVGLAQEELSYFGAMMAAEDVADNWPWILTMGIFNVLGGFLCLIAPVAATVIAEAIMAWTFTVIGVGKL